jgi:hypothetical protein
MGFKVRSQIEDSAYVHALHRHVHHYFQVIKTCFDVRLTRLIVQKYQNFVYYNFNFAYYMTAEGGNYLKNLRIVRDFTAEVS